MVMEMPIETKGGLWGYYRQPNGWITVAITTEIETVHYIKEGWTPLPQYGGVEMTSKYAADHPFEPLFIAGGAKELSIEQIRETGLYLDPPLVPACGRRLSQYHKRHAPECWRGAKPVVFPQLEGLDLEPARCRHCDNEYPTEAARDQHETVSHKESQGDIKMGEALGQALAQALQTVRMPFICGLCNQGFDKPTALVKHVKEAHDDGGS